MNEEILAEIQEYALDIDWNKAFNGKAHGNRHLYRVVIIATFLAQKEGASQEICQAGAWLHDIGLREGNDDNPVTIRRLAEAYLENLELSAMEISRIADCVETHEGSWEAVSLEARIVHDADVLDKMGLLGIIRHTWKITNLIAPQASAEEVCDLVQAHLRARKERLYTATASKLVRYLDEAQDQFFACYQQAIKDIALIIQQARQGITSDKIANSLISETDNHSLQYQISINPQLLQWRYEQEKRKDRRGFLV